MILDSSWFWLCMYVCMYADQRSAAARWWLCILVSWILDSSWFWLSMYVCMYADQRTGASRRLRGCRSRRPATRRIQQILSTSVFFKQIYGTNNKNLASVCLRLSVWLAWITLRFFFCLLKSWKRRQDTAILLMIEGHETAFNGFLYRLNTGKPLKTWNRPSIVKRMALRQK
jgi:hypothetical protein